MKWSFVWAMVRRESRGSRRQLVLYVGSIALGVGALVAINAFRADMTAAIRSQSRTLLGADLELRSRRPFNDSLQALIDSVATAGDRVSRMISLGSMILAERSGGTRLVEVRGIEGGFPFYGVIETEPVGAWNRLQSGPQVVVDPSLLVHLDARVGDTVLIGESRLVISGTLTRVPGEIGLRAAIGPRVYLAARYLEGSSLLSFGSRARYATYLAVRDPGDIQLFLNRYNASLERWDVRYDTVAEREEDFTSFLDTLARFLGLVGLIALLLGGIGIASAVHLYVRHRIPAVATLRCLGAESGVTLTIYVLQAVLMGLAGAAVGAVLGVVVQLQLPALLGDFLPLELQPALRLGAIAVGMVSGVWVSFVFAALPLLKIRKIPPLRALRQDIEGIEPDRDPLQWLLYVSIAGTVMGLGVWQAPGVFIGLLFAGAIGLTALTLWASAVAVTTAAHRFFPRRAPYVIRQGVANLFRPHNQTVAVTVALGLGVFLLGTLHLVQRSLLTQFSLDTQATQANIVVFDIQPDQLGGVVAAFRAHGEPAPAVTPIVPARLSRINGRTVDELLHDSAGAARNRWPLTREYRHTYRDTMVSSEVLTAGWWWNEKQRAEGQAARISLEEDIAAELKVGVGDRITWDVQGVEVETQVASLRRVDWVRFAPNFFAVFEPGVLESVPQTYVTMARLENAHRRAVFQRDVVQAHPNVAVIDLAVIQQTLDRIVRSVSVAIRFMALFSLACGAVVLVGAVAASRYQRLREIVLLRTLGARNRQIAQIVLTEYCALGALAAVVGAGLSVTAAWALTAFFFETAFHLPVRSLALLGAATIAATAVIGLANSGGAVRQTPLAALRQLGE